MRGPEGRSNPCEIRSTRTASSEYPSENGAPERRPEAVEPALSPAFSRSRCATWDLGPICRVLDNVIFGY